ncbi:MAG: DUF4070 domain-containing protein [Acidobacteria bacterium]|nr:MAG: DUF4070 domain-containing protein [Acidobacteriota bacterium]
MKVLLVSPAFPETYWSQKHALPFVRRRALLPPLGLITVAALMPQEWEFELVDLAVEPLEDERIRSADLVAIGGMLVQRNSIHDVLARCRRLGIPTVVGGPYAMAMPEQLDDADHLVLGEGEDLVPRFASDFAAGRAARIYKEEGKPDLSKSPTPRFDLLDVGAYHQMAVQFSRGCPFHCEFCDIIVMYGRKPRVKTPEQILKELDAIKATGFSGDVFFVDDNFIGNKRAAKQVLPRIAEWLETTRAPLSFFTEASMNLAEDPELMQMMTRAGFHAVFVGIESPSPESLKETTKVQNIKGDIVERIHRILRHGLDVWGGYILGFDSDGPGIFERMIRFVQESAVPYSMVGILGALPNTPLYERLKKEGRLRELTREMVGDQFGLTNVVTKIPARQLLEGYRKVMEVIYDPVTYFERCKRNLERWNPPGTGRGLALRELWAGVRSIVTQGFSAPYRKAYWRFLGWVLKHHPKKIGRAVAQAVVGHHYITYTREVVLPALQREIEKLDAGDGGRRLAAGET